MKISFHVEGSGTVDLEKAGETARAEHDERLGEAIGRKQSQGRKVREMNRRSKRPRGLGFVGHALFWRGVKR